MATKDINDDDFDSDMEMLDDFEDIDEALSINFVDARRRLEQLREDRELERLINGGYDDLP